MTALETILESASQAKPLDGEWIAVAIVVLLLILRHAVIAFLSRSEKRR